MSYQCHLLYCTLNPEHLGLLEAAIMIFPILHDRALPFSTSDKIPTVNGIMRWGALFPAVIKYNKSSADQTNMAHFHSREPKTFELIKVKGMKMIRDGWLGELEDDNRFKATAE